MSAETENYGACAECPEGKHGIVSAAGRCVCCSEDMFPTQIKADNGRTYTYAGRDESDPTCGMYGGMAGYSFNYKAASALAI